MNLNIVVIKRKLNLTWNDWKHAKNWLFLLKLTYNTDSQTFMGAKSSEALKLMCKKILGFEPKNFVPQLNKINLLIRQT